MAIKVKAVLDEKTGQKVTTKNCDDGYKAKTGYICPTAGCNAEMSFVGFHSKTRKAMVDGNYTTKIIYVDSYFKLKPGQEHKNCQYDATKRVEIIAKGSDPDFIRALESGKYKLSLLLPIQNKQPSNTFNKNISHKGYNYGDNVTTNYIPLGKANSYIKTLKQVLKLRTELESNKDMAKNLVLNYNNKAIPWSQFYFEFDDYKKAYQVAKTNNYPICLHGEIKKIRPPKDKYPYNVLQLEFLIFGDDDKDIYSPQLSIKDFDKFTDLKNISEGDEILVYGVFRSKEAFSSDNNAKFYNLQNFIQIPQQIMVI